MSNYGRPMLPEGFQPSERDVICGRGKKCYDHQGNKRFQQMVIARLDEYSQAKSKVSKSEILANLCSQVRRDSPDGGFVKQDKSGRWYEIGDFQAREKASQFFRDALHEHYKSSKLAKKNRNKKRRQEKEVEEACNRLKEVEAYSIHPFTQLENLSSESKHHDLSQYSVSPNSCSGHPTITSRHLSFPAKGNHKFDRRGDNELNSCHRGRRKYYSATNWRGNKTQSRSKSPSASFIKNEILDPKSPQALDFEHCAPFPIVSTSSPSQFDDITAMDEEISLGDQEPIITDEKLFQHSSSAVSCTWVRNTFQEFASTNPPPLQDSAMDFVTESNDGPSLHSVTDGVETLDGMEPLPFNHIEQQQQRPKEKLWRKRRRSIIDNDAGIFDFSEIRQAVCKEPANMSNPIPYMPITASTFPEIAARRSSCT